MPTIAEVNDVLDSWNAEAFRLYGETMEGLERERVGFVTTTPNGLADPDSSGMLTVLSRSEVSATQASMSWAFSLWTNSGILPDAHHLSGYVQSMGGGTVASICTLSCLAQAAATLALTHSGSDALVSHVSGGTYPGVEQSPTSPSTSQKTSATKGTTESSPPTGSATVRSTRTPASPTARKRGTKGTSNGSGSRRKKTRGKKRKSYTRKGMRKKQTKG